MVRTLAAGFFALLALPALAAVNVFATVPEWAALARELGGDKVKVYAATHALQDPHRIEARPSLLAQARSAQLVVATGADLEIGWLPVVLRDSGNAAIQPGQPGYFEAARWVTPLEIPASLDRAQGDVHPEGNPHIQLDPRNILKVAAALTARLAQIDPANAKAYQANGQGFADRWQAAMVRWERQGAVLKGVPVLVHHRSFSYLLTWLGLRETGTLEPKPGVEPTSGQLSEILARQQSQPAKMVLRAAYQNDGPSQWIAGRAKIPAVVLPFTVGGSKEAQDLFALYDETLARLLEAVR
ncbi:MAG TPA: zinc ABC transporter substrate-binding protein [Rhodocyclaceae bacterium]|nr:zinc ABC transporter substrate-binding protein [Betaproteobacteria bacterium]HMU99492.1 zinc ABC transporter substrate-binding protein [Rhodocyclaceae bacterium]HMV21888.1 zinc ABC transporter substrate-binding protein [Rhodocyclaceae bacterium]HMW77326.1 zinc ABC transporter substrate-binding protein [Rhodocyclaceae bacterium]HNL20597.1 zinc ABC transporter substrate-binding protein [Rhodocyclaceae bacterium]